VFQRSAVSATVTQWGDAADAADVWLEEVRGAEGQCLFELGGVVDVLAQRDGNVDPLPEVGASGV
jgi:hypothetical protein